MDDAPRSRQLAGRVDLVGGPLHGARAWVDRDVDARPRFASIGGGLAIAIDDSDHVDGMLIVHRYTRRDNDPAVFEFDAA